MAEVADELRRAVGGRRGHLRPQPQHQLHQRLHLQVPVLRVLEGPAVAQPAGHALPAHPRRHPAAGASRRWPTGPPRSASRAASTPTSTATTTSTWPGPCRPRRPTSTSTASPPSRSPRAPSAWASRWPTTCGGSWTPGCAPCPAPRPRSSTTRCGRCCAPTRSTPRSGSTPTAPPTRSGLRSNVTIMFGSVEQPSLWARHLVRTRALQKETGGFTEFVPLPFVHMAAPIYLQHKARRGPTFREALLMHAVGRIAYRGWIDNIQVSWVKMGRGGATQILQAGRQRPRRHADGREHLPGRRRHPRPDDGRGRLPGAGRAARPAAGAAHHALRPPALTPAG